MNSMRKGDTGLRWICIVPGCTFPCEPGCFHVRWITWTASRTNQNYGLVTLVRCLSIVSHTYCTARPTCSWGREGQSLTSDSDIVEYFKKVLEIRTKLNLNKWGWSWSVRLQMHVSLGKQLGLQICRDGNNNCSSFYPWYDISYSHGIWTCFLSLFA